MPKPLNVDWPAVRVLAVAVGVREAARQMGISQDAVRQRSKREGWMASPKTVAQRALAKPVTSVSPTALSPADALANVFSEQKHRTKLGLSKFAAEAAEQAAGHPDKLEIAGKVKDVASVHRTLWPDEPKTNEILPGWRILIGAENVNAAKTGYVCDGPDKGKFFPVYRDHEKERSKELPSPVFAQSAEVMQPALQPTPEGFGSASDCIATDVTPEGTPAPMQHQGPGAQPAEAVNAPWEEPRDRAVIFKCRRSRRG